MIAERVRLTSVQDLGSPLAALVGRLAAATGLSHAQTYRLRLAAEEVASNIATHGYGGRPGPIDVDTGHDADWVWVRIEDSAPAFDPTGHDPAPRLAADPALAPLGGFGLFLAMSSVDRFEYEYAAGRNHNAMSMRRGSSNAGGTDGKAGGAAGDRPDGDPGRAGRGAGRGRVRGAAAGRVAAAGPAG